MDLVYPETIIPNGGHRIFDHTPIMAHVQDVMHCWGYRNFGYGLPSEAQVKEYMTLALHLIQKLQRIQD